VAKPGFKKSAEKPFTGEPSQQASRFINTLRRSTAPRDRHVQPRCRADQATGFSGPVEMQEAGHALEKSTALGVLMENEERRLVEAVRRCDVWAMCSSLVLGVQVELLIGVVQATDYDEWSEGFRVVYTASSALALMCMGIVAYDVLRAAEEAQALAHAQPATGGCSWLGFDRLELKGRGHRYPPLETMRAAVKYLHRCLREMRLLFSFGLLMSGATFFCFIGSHSPPQSPSFIAGVLVVVATAVARQLWRRNLKKSLVLVPLEEWDTRRQPIHPSSLSQLARRRTMRISSRRLPLQDSGALHVGLYTIFSSTIWYGIYCNNGDIVINNMEWYILQ